MRCKLQGISVGTGHRSGNQGEAEKENPVEDQRVSFIGGVDCSLHLGGVGDSITGPVCFLAFKNPLCQENA
jgi:predicted aconitase with swiveling domain